MTEAAPRAARLLPRSRIRLYAPTLRIDGRGDLQSLILIKAVEITVEIFFVQKQKRSLALSILLFSGVMAMTALAHADDTPSDAPSRHTEAPPDSPPST